MKIVTFFLTNPWAVIALLVAAAYGWMKWQGYQIADLKLEKAQLESTVKVERQHHTKVVAAFEDKGVKEHDRESFKTDARASIASAGKAGAVSPSPVLADAYGRVYARYSARTAKDTR